MNKAREVMKRGKKSGKGGRMEWRREEETGLKRKNSSAGGLLCGICANERVQTKRAGGRAVHGCCRDSCPPRQLAESTGQLAAV